MDALGCHSVGLHTLDISECGLSSGALRDIFTALSSPNQPIQCLDVSDNRARIYTPVVSRFLEFALYLRKLNVSGVLAVGYPLFTSETLERLEHLEHLDISRFKVSY